MITENQKPASYKAFKTYGGIGLTPVALLL